MNDLMAKVAMAAGFDSLIERTIVPPLASMTSILLKTVFKIENLVEGGSIFIKAQGALHEIVIGWNCVGWQSFFLFAFCIVTGLAGEWTLKSKIKSAVIGLQGIILLNVSRVTAVPLILLRWGTGPATLFHDYVSQVFTFAWLAIFWIVSNELILEPDWEGKTWTQNLMEWLIDAKIGVTRFEFGRIMGIGTMLLLISSIILGGFTLIAGAQASPENWWDESWSYRKLITQDHTEIASDLEDFPMLISGTYTELTSNAQLDGGDIAFASYDGSTKLAHEIEEYDNNTGTLVAWVRVNLTASVDTAFWMYYGNPSAPDQETPTAVWDSDHLGVWHLKEGGTTTRSDSTSNNNHGTPGPNMDTDVDAKVDGGDKFDGTSGQSDRVEWDNSVFNFDYDESFTFETWIKTSTGGRVPLAKGDANTGYRLYIEGDGDLTFYMKVNGASRQIRRRVDGLITDDAWHHVTISYNGSRDVAGLTVYVDSEVPTTQATTDTVSGSDSMQTTLIYYLGRNSGGTASWFNGLIDEVRVSGTTRSADWIEASYQTSNSPQSFYSAAQEIEIPENITYTLLILLALIFLPKVMGR